MTSTQWIILFSGTVFLILFSWFVSLREGRYHGIPRFFAFEGLLALFLLISPAWFIDPFSLRQIVSWLFLCLSFYYVLIAFILIIRLGKPGQNFENTTRLVTTGLYHYVRHPMYGSLFFLGCGLFLKSINLYTIILFVIISVALIISCKVEEKEMIMKFGNDYKDYIFKTKMWIPGVI